ncbi:uncharacterized protein LOC106662462 [Cimex lectularius]|uniref:Uncharacterized protein n=1 Tax=Cimex lectularius TaxID=79782 RepID=A0A8I6RBE6_CIMLE|nr:uncharacterized protein LOC106662462 [Cimex lectularius]
MTMRINMWQIILLLSLAGGLGEERKPDLCQTDTARQFVLDKIDEIKTNTGKEAWQYMAKKKQGVDGQLLVEFREISKAIDDVVKPVLLTRVVENLWAFAAIELEENNINTFYSTFKKYQNKPDSLIYKDSWSDFAHSCLNNSPNKHSVQQSLEIIQDLIYNEETLTNVFQLTMREANEDYLRCEKDQSVQQILFNLYNHVQITQLKAYAMLQFSWMLLKAYDKGNFEMESELFKHKYLERMEQQANSIVYEMQQAPNEIKKCDPLIHKQDETYTELTRFLQGYIVNEVDLNKEKTCAEDCSFYKYTKQHSCFQDQFCAKQPICKGNIVGCNFVDSDMWICQAPDLSTRRYDWIEYENGRSLGQRSSCKRSVTKVDSWWRWLFWHCSYCFCFCDDPKDIRSHRFFNMREVTSDTTNNKVITGLRFVKKNKIIHLQIQQGTLLKNGAINVSTVAWRAVDDYKTDDDGIKAGVDYHVLTWEQRAIDLDDLIAPEGYVLTGVRFRRIGGHLNLEIKVTKMDFKNGTLVNNGKKTMWIGNDNTDGAHYNPRRRLTMTNPDNPIKNSGVTLPDSVHDQFIEFTNSDLDLDAGQTVVPFIDMQVVTPEPPVPLVGAGIYHKGKKYSGGFIAPKVFTMDYSSHIYKFFPEVNEAELIN